MIKWG